MKTLLLEPVSGISGDMLLGTLVDLGVDLDLMREQVAALGLTERVQLEARSVQRAGLAATKVDVLVDGVPEAAGGRPGSSGPDRHDASVPPTNPDRIRSILTESALDPAVRDTATEVFERLTAAEARVHGAAGGHVHLHEVGALDAVVDVVCSVAGLRELGPERIIATPPREGHGEVQASHGTLPVPVPATLVLLEGVELERIDVEGELVTPTGAALLVTLADEITRTFTIRPERIGYGAGSRDLPGRPNLLRGTLGESESPTAGGRDEVVVLETVVDDAVPEIWPRVIERLIEAGARDAWLTPVMMKKGRPGVQLTALAEPGREAEIARLIFSESPTLGLRLSRTERIVTLRAAGTLRTRLGPIEVKLSRVSSDQAWEIHPEFEACRAAADRHGLSLRQVYAEVTRAGTEPEALEVEEAES